MMRSPGGSVGGRNGDGRHALHMAVVILKYIVQLAIIL